jgi:hypothetical protein
MKYKFHLFPIVFLVLSCQEPNKPDPLEQAATEAKFDKVVIHKLHLYDSLKNLAILHYDTLFKFRNNNLEIVRYDKNGTATLIKGGDETSFTFSYNFETDEFQDFRHQATIPSYLKAKFSNLFQRIGKGNIGYFKIAQLR